MSPQLSKALKDYQAAREALRVAAAAEPGGVEESIISDREAELDRAAYQVAATADRAKTMHFLKYCQHEIHGLTLGWALMTGRVASDAEDVERVLRGESRLISIDPTVATL